MDDAVDWWRSWQPPGRVGKGGKFTCPGEIHLFAGQQGRPHVTPATVWYWVRKVADAAGLDPVATHRLRHTALATGNDATRDLRAAMEFARHRRPETTVIYTRAGVGRLREFSRALDYDQ